MTFKELVESLDDRDALIIDGELVFGLIVTEPPTLTFLLDGDDEETNIEEDDVESVNVYNKFDKEIVCNNGERFIISKLVAVEI